MISPYANLESRQKNAESQAGFQYFSVDFACSISKKKCIAGKPQKRILSEICLP